MPVSWRVRTAEEPDSTDTRRDVRTPVRDALPVLATGLLVVALVTASHALGPLPDATASPPPPATSPWVLAAAVLAAFGLHRAGAGLREGWTTWRRVLDSLSVACLAYPGLWALAVLASVGPAATGAAWLTAFLATAAHVPLLAAFSVLPLLSARYLGRGASVAPLALVLTTAGVTVLAFALFFDDYAPLRAAAPVRWQHGDTVGAALHSVFLSTVLLGPFTAARSAWHSDGEGARRLALVTASSLAGTALVLGCAAAGALGGAGAVLVLGAMPVAVAVVGVGCTTALTTDLRAGAVSPPTALPVERVSPPAPSTGSVRARLTPRESEVVALLAQGLSNAGIAARLVVSERTVDAHLRSAFVKLDLPEGPEQNRRVHAVLAWRDADEKAV